MQIVAPGVQLLEQIHDRFAVARIEVTGRLVREQDRGLPASARATATRCC
jgi:hypothetical protein